MKNEELEKLLAEFEHWSYTRTTAHRERVRQRIIDLFAQTVPRDWVIEHFEYGKEFLAELDGG